MLEAPEIQAEKIVDCLRNVYNLTTSEVVFLPLGADMNTAVYRVVTTDAAAYFLKLRRCDFDDIGVLVPRLLRDQGLTQVIPPVRTEDNRLWVAIDHYAATLYPFVEGEDGYAVVLTDAQWVAFGAAVRAIHDTTLPPELASRIPRETFSSRWRETVRSFMVDSLDVYGVDPIAAEMTAYLRGKREEVLSLIDQTETLAQALMTQPQDLVMCHADLHAGNILISDSQLYIVDWDTLILAPRERDLMVPGGAQGYQGYPPAEQERLFFQGYGSIAISPQAVAYYRGERIIEDIAVECRQVFSQTASAADRVQEFAYLRSNFTADGPLAAVYRTHWR